MTRWGVLLVPLMLAACNTASLVCRQDHVQVAAELQACPGGAKPPAPPPVPRTIEQVGAYAMKVERARAATERARAECALRLERLNAELAGQR